MSHSLQISTSTTTAAAGLLAWLIITLNNNTYLTYICCPSTVLSTFSCMLRSWCIWYLSIFIGTWFVTTNYHILLYHSRPYYLHCILFSYDQILQLLYVHLNKCYIITVFTVGNWVFWAKIQFNNCLIPIWFSTA